MTPWLATGSHRCSTGTTGSPSVHVGTHGSSPGAGERTGQETVAPGSCIFPRARAGKGGFQLILEAYRAFKGGEPPIGTCPNETPGCRHLSS